jgi:hypothetical protein
VQQPRTSRVFSLYHANIAPVHSMRRPCLHMIHWQADCLWQTARQ